ncbi:MAG: hypothetical protein KGL39_17420 [Patescibacteria group bacterium]|nr:hypothetical protein [Patescibacteria group bacterium]
MTVQTCPTCGRAFRHADKPPRKRTYCSAACRRSRTPKMIAAEQAWGRPIDALLLDWLNRGMTQDAIAGLVGIQSYMLIRWMRTLGIRRVVRYEMRGEGA